MKRLLFTVLLFLQLAPAAPANEIKAMLGAHSSKYLFSDEVAALSRRQKSGLAFGLGYAFAIAAKMELEADIVYGEKGAAVELAPAPGALISGIYRNTSISVPLLFKYRLTEGASPYAALGPEFVFVLSHHLELPALSASVDISDNTKKFVFAVSALLGYELPLNSWRLFAELRFERWLGDFLLDPAAAARSESIALVIGAAYTI